MGTNRSDFEDSVKRARKAYGSTHVLRDGTVKDFQWVTGCWFWLPTTFCEIVRGWNPTGGEATHIQHSRRYWFCMGWSTMVELGKEEIDGRDQKET